MRAIIAGLLGVGVLSSAPSKGTAEAPRHLPLSAVVRVTRGRTNEPTELPDDPELPALGVIRERGLAGSIPSLGLGGAHVKLRLCGYTPGARATPGPQRPATQPGARRAGARPRARPLPANPRRAADQGKQRYP